MKDYFDKVAAAWDGDPMKIERAQVTAQQLRRQIPGKSKSLLDFGGGTGLLSFFLHDCFDSITIADSSNEMLKIAEEKIQASGITNINTTLIREHLGEITQRYSAIITLMTLHHIEDIDGFLKSAAALLENNGTLFIADLYNEDGSFHQHVEGYSGHNGFTKKNLSTRLNHAGFKVVQLDNYFEITKKNSSGKEQTFPLFFLVAEKI